MAFATQQSQVELMSELTGLTRDIFVGDVQNNVKRESPAAMLFEDADPGDFNGRFEGQNTVFAVDLEFKTGGVASSGKIPDYTPLDAVQGKVTPIRRYDRVALDNLTELRAAGQGSFQPIGDRIFNTLWDSWKSMTIRHAIGLASGVVCKVTSRTSSTVFVVEDGYNHDGTNPVLNLARNSVIGWYDVSAAQVGGAGVISSLARSTRTITMDSATTWEVDVGNQIAAGDFIFFATSNRTTNDHFELERNLAPNGFGTILDPDAAASTVFNIAEGTYPNWKPYRVASATFDHMEVTEHWLKLAAQRGFKVSGETDVAIAHPSAIAQLARSLMGVQQQAYTGDTLKGGYSGVTIRGIEFMEDHFFYHDVAATVCKQYLKRVNIGGDADFISNSGSMWEGIPNYDGKSAYVGEYMNYLCTHRGANGLLTGIVTPDVVDSDFDGDWSY